MIAEIISIGTEFTSGLALDTNSAWLSRRLGALGIPVHSHHTVADEQPEIRAALEASAARCDLLLVTGGLAPTPDDLTRQALAEALGVALETDAQALAELHAFFVRMQRSMPESNAIQAQRPRGSRTIPNTRGTAPGIHARLQRADVYVLPGVPEEMMTMFERSIAPELAGRAGDQLILTRTLHCFGAAEAVIGEKLAHLMRRGRNPSVGTTAKQAVISIRIVASGPRDPRGAPVQNRARERADADVQSISARDLPERDVAEIKSLLAEVIFGEEDDTLQSVVGRMLIDKRLTLSTAESCTGGLLAKRLTDISGSSAYFLRGFVTYSNQAKLDLLGVPELLLTEHGAVSEPVAEAMAANCRALSDSDSAISITGIAGPTGGTPDKPVGLVYIGLADRQRVETHRYLFGEHLTRAEIRDRTCKTALNLLRLRLLGTAANG
ncbi:MAG TPA: competence/damage-inducible protein A [Phycisphaerae bacterium]|jgi:nicotinamide-nucleotide amidase